MILLTTKKIFIMNREDIFKIKRDEILIIANRYGAKKVRDHLYLKHIQTI